jgi:NADH-quinone oxidoreductase subunit J
MEATFYLGSAIAILATLRVITQLNPMHALLYLIVSLLAVAMVFYSLGAPFAAALEVLVYAGAIMVLIVFVVMMLNLGRETVEQERHWLTWKMWIGPGLLALILLGQLLRVLLSAVPVDTLGHEVDAKAVGVAMFGPYLLAVELASMLLLAGLVGAYHLGKREEASILTRGPEADE